MLEPRPALEKTSPIKTAQDRAGAGSTPFPSPHLHLTVQLDQNRLLQEHSPDRPHVVSHCPRKLPELPERPVHFC